MLSGVVWCGAVVASFSRKSKLVCLSSCEAELAAAVQTMRLAMDIVLQAQLFHHRAYPTTLHGHPAADRQPAGHAAIAATLVVAIGTSTSGFNSRHNISTTDLPFPCPCEHRRIWRTSLNDLVPSNNNYGGGEPYMSPAFIFEVVFGQDICKLLALDRQ